jgi:hypothetical protein
MTDKLLTTRQVANRWQQSKQTIDRYRKLGKLPWIDLSGGSNIRPVVRFRILDIEAYEDNMRLQPMPLNKNAKPIQQESKNVSHPRSISDEGPKLIRRIHASK